MFQFFVKQFPSLLSSWIADDSDLLTVTQRLLLICDEKGVINMDYPVISRLVRLPVELLVAKIDILQQPQPRSRDQAYEGRTLVRLDPNRNWGWRFVNYEKFRKLRDPRERREYKTDWQRTHRGQSGQKSKTRTNEGGKGRSRADQEPRGQAVDNRTDLPRENVDSRGQPEDTGGQSGHIQNKNQKVPPAVPQGGQQPTDFEDLFFPKNAAQVYRHQLLANGKNPDDYVLDWREAKRLICQKILGGRNPDRPWGDEAMRNLAKQMPIPRIEIERIAWFRGLKNDGTPELEARKFVTEVGLMTFWSDEFGRANSFWQELYAWEQGAKPT